ncbi:MAG: response regulator [Myxococcales bacterium]|nr:response regulator [Myxococcales bacterium]
MRVVLIEDNPIDAQALLDRLSGQSIVEVALTRVESIAQFRAMEDRSCDAILLDLTLEDSQGPATLHRVQALAPDVPVVVLTADADDSRSLEMVRGGAEDYLVKGRFSTDSLVRVLRYAVERAQLKRRLVHADRLVMVGQLAAGVAHEVATPAAFVLANMGMLGEQLEEISRDLGVLAEPGADIARHIADLRGRLAECGRWIVDNDAGMNRICAVVRDLQGYSKLDRDQVSGVDLNQVVVRAVKLVNPSVRHQAEVVLALGDLPTIEADGNKLEQVITNLVVNAAQAIEVGQNSGAATGRITVRTAAVGRTVVMSVEDTGVGMSEDVRTRVFEPFFTTRAREHGTGLGLAIVAEIVAQHGGEVDCQSRPGRGTRFDVRLPIGDTVSVPASLPAPAPRKHSGTTALPFRGRILFVDDEPSLGRVYGRLVRKVHDATIVESAREALELIGSGEKFDVVVCDLMMPEMDGAQFFERVREQYPQWVSRIVFCTGGVVTERSRRLVSSVDNLLLHKPVSREELLQAIDSVMFGGQVIERSG